MCEILLRVKDDPLTGNPAIDCGVWRAGYIVAVVPDGWTWGECELGGPTYTDADPKSPTFGQKLDIAKHPAGNHNFWRILKLPGVSMDTAAGYCAPEVVPVGVDNPHPLIRGYSMKLDVFPADVQAYLADDSRAQPLITSLSASDAGAKQPPDKSGATATTFDGFTEANPSLATQVGNPAVVG